MPNTTSLPVAIIGAGPIGLAAAAHLHARGEAFVILEAGQRRRRQPAPVVPRSGLQPVALPDRRCRPRSDGVHLLVGARPRGLPDRRRDRLGLPRAACGDRPNRGGPPPNTRVTSVSRKGDPQLRAPAARTRPSPSRSRPPARKASCSPGPSSTPAEPGPRPTRSGPVARLPRVSGRPAIASWYGIPDANGVDRDRYAGKRVLVVGSGHSAFNAVLAPSLWPRRRLPPK